MDTGVSPERVSKLAYKYFINSKKYIYYASTREIYNIFDAIKLNYQIITVSPNILAKMKILTEVSINTQLRLLNNFIKMQIVMPKYLLI